VTGYLRSQGFPAVSNIQGGIAAWAEHFDPAMRRY
jgi:rhodanese-related sulfurtransferase